MVGKVNQKVRYLYIKDEISAENVVKFSICCNFAQLNKREI